MLSVWKILRKTKPVNGCLNRLLRNSAVVEAPRPLQNHNTIEGDHLRAAWAELPMSVLLRRFQTQSSAELQGLSECLLHHRVLCQNVKSPAWNFNFVNIGLESLNKHDL